MVPSNEPLYERDDRLRPLKDRLNPFKPQSAYAMSELGQRLAQAGYGGGAHPKRTALLQRSRNILGLGQ